MREREREREKEAAERCELVNMGINGDSAGVAFDTGTFRERVRWIIDREIIANASSSSCTYVQSLACLRTLKKIVDNIVRAPEEESFRRVRCSSQSFRTKVEALEGGVAFLCAIGFRKRVIEFAGYYVMDDEEEEEVNKSGKAMDSDGGAERWLKKIKELKVAQEELDAAVERMDAFCQAKERQLLDEKGEDELRRRQVKQAIEDDKIERRERRDRKQQGFSKTECEECCDTNQVQSTS